MSTKKLFIKRLIQEWRYQWGVIHTVLDGVVFIYIVVPLLFVGTLVYRNAWKDISLYWQDYFPFAGLMLIILLLASNGNFRTFLLEADLLFLIQKKKTLYQLKVYGFILSIIKALLQVTILLVIALPVLRLVYHFSYLEVCLLFLGISGYKLVVMTIKKIFKRALYRRMLIVLTFIIALLCITYLPVAIYGFLGILLMVITIIFQQQAAKSNQQFSREIEIENTEHHKYTAFLIGFSAMLGSSVEIEKPSTYQRKKPLFLFRHSKRIFKTRSEENGLLEFCLKAFLRNKSYRSSYFQAIAITSLLIAFLPLWLKGIIYIIFVLFMHSWMKGIYLKTVQHSFFQVVHVDKLTIFSTQKRFQRWTTLPVVILLGFSVLLQLLVLL